MSRPGRNEPCHCGSGKKYKKCCLDKDDESARAMTAARAYAESDDLDDTDADDAEYDDDDDWDDFDDDDDAYDDSIDDIHDGQVDEDDESRSARPLCDRYPQIVEALPPISEADEALVEAWWEEVKEPFHDRDADEMIRRMLSFMETRPDLFVHLDLHQEFLFELGAELSRRQQYRRFTDLLEMIREKHPEVYRLSFGYYDRDLVGEYLATGRTERIPECFSFFRTYRDSFGGEADEIGDLLAWTGMEMELGEFARILPPPRLSEVDFWGPPPYHYVIFREAEPFLDSGLDPLKAAEEFVAAALRHDIPARLKVESIRRGFELARGGEILSRILANAREASWELYIDVGWAFFGYLRRSAGLGWVQCHFLADRLLCYWLNDRSKPRQRTADPFLLAEKKLDAYIARRTKLFYLDGLVAVPFLQAVWHFVPFLAAQSAIEPDRASQIQASCSNLYNRCRKLVEATDPASRLITTFPEMRDVAGKRGGGVTPA